MRRLLKQGRKGIAEECTKWYAVGEEELAPRGD
jgi:hypothetical protein